MAIRVKLNLDTLVYEQIFEKVCHVRCKGIGQGIDQWIFVVPMGKAGKAIGAGAQNIKKLQEQLSRRNSSLKNTKVRIVEFHPNIKIFVKNLLAPIEVERIEIDGNTVKIIDSSKKTKSLLIGPGARRLKQLNSIIERFFQKNLSIE